MSEIPIYKNRPGRSTVDIFIFDIAQYLFFYLVVYLATPVYHGNISDSKSGFPSLFRDLKKNRNFSLIFLTNIYGEKTWRFEGLNSSLFVKTGRSKSIIIFSFQKNIVFNRQR